MEYKIIWTSEDIESEIKRLEYVRKSLIPIKNKVKKQKKQKPQKTATEYKGKEGYKRYLSTKWWKKRRKRYWDKHERKCYCCGTYATELHHNNYSRLFKELDKDFVPLCHSCHTKVHNFVKGGIKLKKAHDFVKNNVV